jgi:folylpolyglutamate synthase/dihydropteroate synthase
LPARDITVRAAAEFCTRLAGTRVLILLDEFDRSEALTFKRDIAEFLKNLSDRQARCQLVIAGVASDLSEMLAEIPSIRRNIYALSVPRMQADEVRQLINHGEATSQLDFSPEAVEQIVQTANGLPYLASLLCQHMGLAALGQGRQTVVVEDVAAAIEDILADLETQLSARARDHIGELIHSRAHVYLGRLAGHVRMTNAEFDVKAVDAVYSADTSVQVRRLLAELASDGRLLEADEGEFGRHYRFVDSNAPQYLWLLSEQARILGFQEPTELRSTLEAGKANADVKPSSPEPASKAGASRYL